MWSIDEYTIPGALLLMATIILQMVWVVALMRSFPDITEPNKIARSTAKISEHTVQDPSESSTEVIWATEKEHPDIKARDQNSMLPQQSVNAKGLLVRASQTRRLRCRSQSLEDLEESVPKVARLFLECHRPSTIIGVSWKVYQCCCCWLEVFSCILPTWACL